MLTAETELTLLTATLTKLDSEITQLCHRRSQLRRKLNELTCATRQLPPEVLTEIFRLSACKPNLREPKQLYHVDITRLLKIGSVCSHWRQIAWSVPKLWSTCLLSILTPPRGLDDDMDEPRMVSIPISLTLLALRNCQHNGSLAVLLDLDDSHYMERMEVLFNQGRTQLGSLRVYAEDENVKDSWNRVSKYFQTASTFPNLKELWIHLSEDSDISGLLFQTSGSNLIQHVRRKRHCVPWDIPISQLTILRLHGVPVDQCMNLLLQGPNLVEFHCIYPTDSSQIDDPIRLLPLSERPKSLHSIKQLRWKAFSEDSEWNLFLSSFIRFPHLERLLWGVDTLGREFTSEYPLLERFVSESLDAKLLALDLEGVFHSPTCFTTPITKIHFGSVQQLFTGTRGYSDFVTWLETLTLYEDSNQNSFPSLRALHLHINYLHVHEARSFATLHRFLTSRRNRPRQADGSGDNSVCDEYWRNHTRLERLTVETYEEGPIWDEDQVEILKGFVTGGLVVEVVWVTGSEEQKFSTIIG